MLKLDNNLLQELGLHSLPDDQKRSMLQHIYDTLELRVGTRLASQMSDQQLQEFEKFIDAGGDNNQAQALQWLETNLPNYKQVVSTVFEELKAEIKQMAPQILATTVPVAGQVQPQTTDEQHVPAVHQPAPSPTSTSTSAAEQLYVDAQSMPPQPQSMPPQPQSTQSWPIPQDPAMHVSQPHTAPVQPMQQQAAPFDPMANPAPSLTPTDAAAPTQPLQAPQFGGQAGNASQQPYGPAPSQSFDSSQQT